MGLKLIEGFVRKSTTDDAEVSKLKILLLIAFLNLKSYPKLNSHDKLQLHLVGSDDLDDFFHMWNHIEPVWKISLKSGVGLKWNLLKRNKLCWQLPKTSFSGDFNAVKSVLVALWVPENDTMEHDKLSVSKSDKLNQH